jgi:hypothetical protein
VNARRRLAARRNWPANLYQNSDGYLWFKNPLTGKSAGLGTDLQKAIRDVKARPSVDYLGRYRYPRVTVR